MNILLLVCQTLPRRFPSSMYKTVKFAGLPSTPSCQQLTQKLSASTTSIYEKRNRKLSQHSLDFPSRTLICQKNVKKNLLRRWNGYIYLNCWKFNIFPILKNELNWIENMKVIKMDLFHLFLKHFSFCEDQVDKFEIYHFC